MSKGDEYRDYTANFTPYYGGNCLRFSFCGKDILRFPHSEREFKASPLLYGIPILTPPNRIKNGKFTFNEKEYVFPINEPALNNHLHGALYTMPVAAVERDETSVTFLFKNRKGSYLGFFHDADLTVKYTLNDSGLCQQLTAANLSDTPMPFAVAFHTAFLTDSCSRLKVRAEGRYVRNMSTYLTTGEYETEFLYKRELNSGSFIPDTEKITDFFKVKDGLAILSRDGFTVNYDAPQYPYKHIINKGMDGFICIEPQTTVTDGLNIGLSPKDANLIVLQPNKSRTFFSKIYVT